MIADTVAAVGLSAVELDLGTKRRTVLDFVHVMP